MTGRVLVVGLGNPDRGDDGAGAAVVKRLGDKVPDGVTLTTRTGDLLAMLGEWSGFDALICVDAAASLGAPGTVHRFNLADGPLPRELSAPSSSHALGLADALAMGEVLGRLPPTVIVFAIEAETFETGVALSTEVASALDPVARLVRAELRRLRQTEDSDA